MDNLIEHRPRTMIHMMRVRDTRIAEAVYPFHRGACDALIRGLARDRESPTARRARKNKEAS
jgi:hypothetical protein